jgi:ferritin-like metal-binding protein YciE
MEILLRTYSNTKFKNKKVEDTTSLRDLFEKELINLYWAESTILTIVPKMILNSSSDELTEALIEHLSVIKEQMKRIEEAFTSINIKAVIKKNTEISGLIQSTEEIINGTEQGLVRDQGIILAIQKMAHFKIACYGTLCAFANTLGEREVYSLLFETLNQEKAANDNFSDIAFLIELENNYEVLTINNNH